VILVGNFDLSLGSIYALTGVLAADAANDWGTGYGYVVPLVVGAGLGVINGVLVTKLRINTFLATLASSLAYGGAAVAISGGLLIQVNSTAFLVLGQDSIEKVQYSVIVFAAVAVVLQMVMSLTVFGRHCYGVGGNPRAARLSGVRTDRYVIATFAIAGLGAGLAGLLNVSATGSGDSSSGTSLALTAIAAVALGGTSIFGGVGAVWRTIVGVLVLALVVNGLDLLGVEAFYQDIVKGGLIAAAVAVSSLARSPDSS
jgi:ribose transport system permease protein